MPSSAPISRTRWTAGSAAEGFAYTDEARVDEADIAA